MKLARGKSAKLLGVTISHDLSWNEHIDNVISKVAKRVHMIYQLKRSGINQQDLITVYLSVVRPLIEYYACPLWHTNLPKYLSDDVEMVQKKIMKSIYPGMSYIDILKARSSPV